MHLALWVSKMGGGGGGGYPKGTMQEKASAQPYGIPLPQMESKEATK